MIGVPGIHAEVPGPWPSGVVACTGESDERRVPSGPMRRIEIAVSVVTADDASKVSDIRTALPPWI